MVRIFKRTLGYKYVRFIKKQSSFLAGCYYKGYK